MSDFSIPMDFMNNYIFKAKPEFGMVYLFAYRYASAGENVPSCADIAQALRLPPETVEAACGYWEDKGFALPSVVPPRFDKSSYSPESIADKADTKFKFICSNVEKALGKMLSTSDYQTLYWIYDYLGFSPAVILLIVNYAVRESKVNMRYIEKTSIAWAEKGLFTPEAVEKHLSEIAAYKSYENKIKQLFGINGRELTPSEKKLLYKWEETYKPSSEELKKAFEICVERTGKLSLKYINGILTKWREGAASAPYEKKKSRYGNFSNRTDIDYEQLELSALKKRMSKQ